MHHRWGSAQYVSASTSFILSSMVMKASHAFNLLDARHAISVTERARYIGRVRSLSRAVAEGYLHSREALGFPLCLEAKSGAAK